MGGSYYSALCPEDAKQFGFVPADEDPIVAHFTVFGDGSISEVDWGSVPDDPEQPG